MAEIDPRISPAAAPHGVGIYDRPPQRRNVVLLTVMGIAAVIALAVALFLFLRHT